MSLLVGFLSAQTPFAGMYVEEVVIDPAALPVINAQAPGARCWRVYVCFDEPFWELQSVFGYVSPGNNFPLDISLDDPATTRFFQSPAGGLSSSQINAALYSSFPSLMYDSFLTFKRYNSTNNQMNLGPGGWGNVFETGGNMVITDPIGGSWYIAFDRSPAYDGFGDPIPGTWSTSTQNVPGPDNHIMIMQLTTNGTFSGHLNFAMRELSPNYILATPLNIPSIAQVFFTNAPGVMDLPCAVLFLPVNVTHFDAIQEVDRVNLNWVTESEVNNDYFTIERSADGQEFEEVFRMEGAGSSSTRRIYSGVDHNPLRGTSYYRLRQTDFDGQSEVSDVVAVEFTGLPAISIYPNPFSGEVLNVKGNTESVDFVRILNTAGKIVFDEQVGGRLFKELNLAQAGLSDGLYFVEFIMNDGSTVTQKLIIEK